jgi:HEAT repeat protein
LFVDLAPSLSGVQRQRITALALELGLLARAATHCRSRLWWRRLQSVRLFTLLGGAEEAVLPLFQDRYAIIRAQAALWAVDAPRPAVLAALLDLLGDASGLCRFTAQDTLLRLGRGVAEPLARALPTLAGRQLEAALTVAVGLAEPRFLAPALTLCTHASPRVRAQAATLCGALGGTQGVQELLDLLTDPVPEVRAAAAHALGKLGHWPAASHLAPLLRDHAWIVRRDAGLALRALGAPGLLYLRRSLTDIDHFAADMARQVLDLPSTVGLETSP